MSVCDNVKTTSVTLISFLTVVVIIAASQSQGCEGNLINTVLDDAALNLDIETLSASSLALLSERTVCFEYVNGTGHEAVIFHADISSGCSCTVKLHPRPNEATEQSSRQERGAILTNITTSVIKPALQNAPATTLHSSNSIDTHALLESHYQVDIQCTGGTMECSAQPERLLLVNCGVSEQCRDQPLKGEERGDHSGATVGPIIVVRPIIADNCNMKVNGVGGGHCVRETSEQGLMPSMKHTTGLSVSEVMLRRLLRAFVLITSVGCVLGSTSKI